MTTNPETRTAATTASPFPVTSAPVTSAPLRYTAFADTPSGGNPAGVVLDGRGLPESRMLAIAADLGYSDTAFLTPAADGAERHYRVRYFSPRAEVDFCGHATVAAAVALVERIGAGPLVFDTPAGEIRVDTAASEGAFTATLTSVPTESRPAGTEELDAALAALRLTPSDLDPALPPRVAFGGVHHLVLPLAARSTLAALDYDFDALERLMTRQGWTTVQIVHREAPDVFHARDPFPVGGVVEDPATGAAAAALGGYLRDLSELPPTGTFTIHQGEDMGRPSHLRVHVAPTTPSRSHVTGRAIPLP
jgi:PhzF family phenazine biosynthesis protein